MNRSLTTRALNALLPLSLLGVVLAGCGPAPATTTDMAETKKTGSAPAKGDTPATPTPTNSGGATGLESLCANHYNRIGLPVDKFERVKEIVVADQKTNLADLKTKLDGKGVTLNEASWGFYYLGLKSIQENDFPNYMKYMTIAADDYLNPWAMVKLAKAYYYDKSEWKKQFPTSDITIDKDLEKSYIYLKLAFVISGEIEKDHQDNAILTGVTSAGLGLQDTFEGTGVQGFDAKATLEKNQADLVARVQMYKTMYEGSK